MKARIFSRYSGSSRVSKEAILARSMAQWAARSLIKSLALLKAERYAAGTLTGRGTSER
jgi:hypothetical protein